MCLTTMADKFRIWNPLLQQQTFINLPHKINALRFLGTHWIQTVFQVEHFGQTTSEACKKIICTLFIHLPSVGRK